MKPSIAACTQQFYYVQVALFPTETVKQVNRIEQVSSVRTRVIVFKNIKSNFPYYISHINTFNAKDMYAWQTLGVRVSILVSKVRILVTPMCNSSAVCHVCSFVNLMVLRVINE